MINRGEGTHQRERCGELPGVLAQGSNQRGGTYTNKKHHHHATAPPEITQATRGNRA